VAWLLMLCVMRRMLSLVLATDAEFELMGRGTWVWTPDSGVQDVYGVCKDQNYHGWDSVSVAPDG
jgi:hypothetical protein